MRNLIILAVLIIIAVIGLMLAGFDQSPLYALLILPIALGCYYIYSIWSPPPKHKEFSDSDRLEATTRALGGSYPPELWTPDMPEPKHHKHKEHKKASENNKFQRSATRDRRESCPRFRV
jgi:hypothetical protein